MKNKLKNLLKSNKKVLFEMIIWNSCYLFSFKIEIIKYQQKKKSMSYFSAFGEMMSRKHFVQIIQNLLIDRYLDVDLFYWH